MSDDQSEARAGTGGDPADAVPQPSPPGPGPVPEPSAESLGRDAAAVQLDYELLRLIGRGSYGEVWLARDRTGTFRAVKVVFRESFDHDRPYEREYEGIRKFEPVSRSYDSQVQILHVGRQDEHGRFYYIMELADDQHPGRPFDPKTYAPRTIKSELKKRGRYAVEDCLRIGAALTSALENLHQHGLIHRDIKPANIIFVHDAPKLADIGLVTDRDLSVSYVGTEGYIPPEGPSSAQADIYSLGKVLYEMSTGRDRMDFPELPTDLDDQADREALLELNAVIARACARSPKDRYRSARHMFEDLACLQRGESVRHRWRRRWMAAAKVTAAVLLVGLSALAVHHFSQVWRARPPGRPATPSPGPSALAQGADPGSPSPALSAPPLVTEGGPGPLWSARTNKKVLVVTVAKTFPHEVIPVSLQVLADLARQDGALTLDYARDDWDLARKMTPTALQQYDGAIFANTTGDLPLPDKQAFLDWVSAGKAFVGVHAVLDTFRGRQPLDPFIQMVGAEFKTHGAQAEVECINLDPTHPACAHLGTTWRVKDEIYLLNGYDRQAVVGLLTLNREPNTRVPGDYPIAWCKNQGRGRVFVTSLGHRPEVWRDGKFQQHLWGGLRWALGLEQAPAPPAGSALGDRPKWTNSLGMVLVTVPATRLRFSIWELRRQDFEVFANATRYDAGNEMVVLTASSWKKVPGYNWLTPGFQQGPTHPAVGLNGDDVEAFCRWLTTREQQAGLIGPAARYRLPTSAEWGQAAGVEGAGVRPGRVASAFSWGSQWPPPAGVANLAGTETRSMQLSIPGGFLRAYNDGFPRTAPVGSFTPNPAGLFDLTGNVWEICQDPFSSAAPERAMRGGSWCNGDDPRLKLSYRAYSLGRVADVGARVVLEDPATPAATAALRAAPLPPGLILYFDFSRPAQGGGVADQSGRGNHGEAVGTQWIAQGKAGGACAFSPAGSYIRVANCGLLNVQRVTLAAWIKTTCQDKVWRRIIDKQHNRGYVLGMGGDFQGRQWRGQAVLEINDHPVWSDGRIADGQWHHLAGTYDGFEQKLYVDGRLQTKVAHWRGNIAQNDFDLTIGNNRSNPDPGDEGLGFHGLIDELMIFNRALASDEIARLYSTGR
jgi:type 1 glutamine amidotransferase